MSSFINGNHIIIGVGGTGGNILKAIRKRYFQEVPSAETRRTTPLGFVYVDSSKELMKPNDPTWKVLGENSQLGNDSFLFVRDASLGSQLENVDDYPGIRSWIGNRKIWDNLVGSVGDDGAAAQRRRLGRFLFSCAVNKYESILKNQVNEVTTIGGKADVTFHIIAGLAGGTGSGSVVDVIAQTRKHFPPNINSGLKYKILVYCLVPESEPLPDWDKGFYHANGFAALQELNALQVKRYIPHDVSGEYEFVPLDGVDKVFNTCFLFTNINENGIPVNTKDALPEIVSDFIFHYLCLQVDDTTRRFEDAYTGENIVDTHENDENARTVEIANEEKPVRTCHFNAFGIKRIVSPEEEIIEYFTYNFARQALLQFKYNNWSDDLGYRDQPRNEDYITFVNDKATLNSWMLSEPHLMLSLPILASEKDQKWRTFQDDWNANIPRLANVAWEKNPSRAINELAKFCDERFEKNFRKVGVPEFYKIKEQARKDIAKEVVDTVGRELFSQWQTGQKSVYEIGRLMVTLIAQTEKRLKSFDGMIISKIGEIDEKYATKAQNEQTWASYGVIPKWLGRKKDLFQAQTTLMQQLYIKKTELEGLRFGKKLLAEIINEMQLLNDEIKSFLDILTQALTASEKEIASRCREKRMSAETLKETVVIKYYDTQEVKKFTDRLIRDQTIQPGQSASIRNLIADLAGSEKTFKVLNEHASEDVLMDIFSQKARDSSIQAHNQLITNKKQKLIGVNIVEKLKEQYGSSDKQTELNDFARNIMESSGVFLTFDNSETTKQLKNNDAPKPGKLIMMNSTLISIPESPDNKDFVDKLVDAFKHNSDGSKTIYIDTKSQRKNEITVINLTSGFSIRMINDAKKLKQKYDLMLKGANPEVAKLVLHLEGDGSQYPRVFTMTPAEIKEKREKLIEASLPYLLIALAKNEIAWQDRGDGTGKKAYCIAQTDDYGYPVPPLVLGEKITDITESPVIDEDFVAELITKITADLQGEYLHITKRGELEEAVKKSVMTVIFPECKNNAADPTFVKFRNAAREADQILKN